MLQTDRLHDLRVNQKYTFEQLAEVLSLSMRHVMRYEAGESEPTAGVIARMSEIFNVSTDYLLGRTDNPAPYHGMGDLTSIEQQVITALRRNDPLAAVKAILCDTKP